MLETILTKLSAIILAPVLMFGGYSAPAHELGVALPAATAVFETSLAAPISSSATSLTLTENSVRGGGSLSGYNCFTVDEGSAQAETLCGTVSGTAVTSITRGISQSTGTSTVAALQFSHRRGANVKITDYPIIQILKALANGEDNFPNPLSYNSIATSTIASDRNYIASVGLVQDIAFNGAGIIDATTNAKGVSELASGAEIAASTATGGSGPLVIPASLATSTYNEATAGNVIPVTGLSTKKIAIDFIDTSTIVASSTIFATTTNGVWTKPANLKYVIVEVVGGGGGGQGVTTGGTSGATGAGGGYSRKMIPASSLGATETVTVGAGGTAGIATGGDGGDGGTTSFGSHLQATGGNGGGGTGSSEGGVGSGGDINIKGGGGGAQHVSNTASVYGSSPGGSSFFGGGAHGNYPGEVGNAGGNYGGGGGSGFSTSAGAEDRLGGAGAGGIVIVTQHF